jgi:hypothetical protein
MENVEQANGMDQSDCPYLPGEVIAQSGLYEICHRDEPRTSVILTVNGFFPFCRKCEDRVRYKLLQAVPHISEDPDFNESPDNLDIEMLTQKQHFPLQLGLSHGFRFWQDTQGGTESSEIGDL